MNQNLTFRVLEILKKKVTWRAVAHKQAGHVGLSDWEEEEEEEDWETALLRNPPSLYPEIKYTWLYEIMISLSYWG